jgi:cyclopropane fatty-acyl-phospholipid synthase-like methyltransferase
MAAYDEAFYKMQARTARRSARYIVPIVLRYIKPMSVVDVGCGTGTWLSVFAENGIADFFGIDGDFVRKEMLEIPPERYASFDLTQMYKSSRRFDLVVSLEVAEHLPAQSADSFVESLVRLGPAVLFSAAIPGQGGTHHINEQWQDYWACLFERHQYIPIDLIRKSIWENEEVAWWYAQNTLLYCEREYAKTNALLAQELASAAKMPLRLVHPRKLDEAVWQERLAQGAIRLAQVIPPGRTFLLVDEGKTAHAFDCCGKAIPFPQKDGLFAGCPSDSRLAIEEMRAMSGSASYIVVVEPAFWWLTYYSDWFDYLQANSQLVLATELLKVFEIRDCGRLLEDQHG